MLLKDDGFGKIKRRCRKTTSKKKEVRTAMARTYITGDVHRQFKRVQDFCSIRKTTREDVLIILGDAGINFYLDDRDQQLKEELSQYPITLFCLHGNHEERPYNIESYITKIWHGGMVYYEEEYPNILFARDGEIYDFEGKKCIAIGGAYSIDKMYRLINNIPWFPDEQPSPNIKKYVEQKLENANWEVDYVLSHTIPKSHEPTWTFKMQIDEELLDKSTERWLDELEEKLSYKRWFAGHYHVDILSPDIRFMFYHIIELNAADVLYHEGDEVTFSTSKQESKKGIIQIVDFYAGFEVTYDILVTDENCIYKHVPNTAIE